MKAAVFYEKGNLQIENIDVPAITRADDVLIKVKACGICGTDMHIFDGDEGAAPTPRQTVLGHEFAGEVVAVGSAVTDVQVGNKVCVDPNKLCNTCDFCREGLGHFCENMVGIGTTVDGGFAEYCLVPQSQVYKFDDRISFTQAAMTEPVACCLHGIEMCNIVAGGTVAIIGGGMIGLLMLQLAKLKGAARLILIEPVAKKRELALSLGADIVIDPTTQNVADVLNGINERISTVIECVGRKETVAQAIDIAGKKATVMLFGLTAPKDTVEFCPFTVFKKELIITASFINPYTQKRALSLINNGKIDVSSMIYKQISVDELPVILADRKERSLGKYIVTFD